MRGVLLVVAASMLVAGCGGAGADLAEPPEKHGTVTLAAVCPQVHLAIDALVVSRPDAQRAFVLDLQRLLAASDEQARRAIEPLLGAARALEQAGTGPDYDTAMRGIHPAVVILDGECTDAGSPILHGGH